MGNLECESDVAACFLANPARLTRDLVHLLLGCELHIKPPPNGQRNSKPDLVVRCAPACGRTIAMGELKFGQVRVPLRMSSKQAHRCLLCCGGQGQHSSSRSCWLLWLGQGMRAQGRAACLVRANPVWHAVLQPTQVLAQVDPQASLAQYYMRPEEVDTRRFNAAQVRHVVSVVAQAFGYMNDMELRYGFISTYEATW